MSTASEDLYGQEHVQKYQETDGELGYVWRNGTTILLLTTKGRKTGEHRTTPLIFEGDDGRFVIVASNGGSPEPPGWFVNIEANPDDVQIQVKENLFPVRATTLLPDDADYERLWTKMNGAWPDYAEYQKKTDRPIPLVVLERTGEREMA